jgi:bacteriocin-like protein
VAPTQFDGISDEDLQAIVGGNAARVFGFDLADT